MLMIVPNFPLQVQNVKLAGAQKPSPDEKRGAGVQIQDVICFGEPKYFKAPDRERVVIEHGKVQYEDVTLSADKVTIYLGPPINGEVNPVPQATVIAEGHAVLTSKVGRVAASYIEFNYKSKIGRATAANIQAPGLAVDAKTVDIVPGKYILHDVAASSTEPRPVFLINAREITVRVGTDLVANNASLKLFGHTVGRFKRLSKSLDDRVSGLNYPSLTLNSALQPGISTNSSILLDNYTAAAGSYGAESRSYPGYSLQVSRSAIDPGQTAGFITPRTNLDERFGYGYFDNVQVHDLQHEQAYVGADREVISVGTFWNRSTVDRLNSQVFSKPGEVTFEKSLGFGSFKTLSQVSVEDVRLESSKGYLQPDVGYGTDHLRFVGETIVEAPNWKLNPSTTGHLRFVGATFDGGNHSFTWAQAQLGAVHQLPRYFKIGAALALATEIGSPLFLSDRLYSRASLNLRSDFAYGPRKISLIGKYDFDRNRFFDRELYFSQLSGLFEPFVAIRAFPGSFRIGFQLRLDNMLRNPASREELP